MSKARKEIDESPLITEHDAWLKIITSDEWKYFLALLAKHQAFLQKEVNKQVKRGDFRLADRAQAKLEDIVRIKDLVQTRLDNLRNYRKGGK